MTFVYGSLVKALLALRSRGITGLRLSLRDRLDPQVYRLYVRGLGAGDRMWVDDSHVAIHPGDVGALRVWRTANPDLPLTFHRDVTDGWTNFLWAGAAGKPIGIVWIVENPPFVRLAGAERAISDLYTAPALRRNGIGAALVSAACQQMQSAQVARAYATVHESNVGSYRLFESLGFHVLGTRVVQGFASFRRRPADWRAPQTQAPSTPQHSRP